MRRHQQGFSLLEILMAFTILALGLGVLYQIFSQGSRAAVLSDDYARAVMIAESRLADADVDGNALTGKQQGTEEDKYHWTITQQSATSFNQTQWHTGVALHNFTVHVSWESLGKQHELQLNTLKLVQQ